MRLTSYTPELASDILQRLADGQTLREICRMEGYPPESTVRTWVLDDREGFAARYVLARELQAETWADEIVSIADDATNDWMKRQDGTTAPDYEHIQRSRLRVDTRKWLLSKMKPGTYGEKVHHAGADGGKIAAEVVYRWDNTATPE